MSKGTLKQHNNSKKPDGTLKKKYSDEPRYKLINGYEGEFTSSFSKIMNGMCKEIVEKIVKETKK